jgi:hypothetical protein
MNRKGTVSRIQAALEELGPAVNAFKSESVQLRLVDGFVLPVLLADEVRGQLEASLEFFIGQAGKLAKGDLQKDINAMQLWLDALQAQKSLLGELVVRVGSRANRKCDEQQLLIDCMIEELERQRAEVKGGETSRDRRKAALDNIQKFLDILRSMNPQI